MDNRSEIFEFVLLGFPGIGEKFHTPVSIALFLVYLTSLFSNGTVIALIACNRHLYQPMYVVIFNLAISDLLFDTVALPKILAKYWFDDGSISYAGCIFQLFCAHFLGSFDSYILLLMAIDRYVAICKPLRYPSIINNRRTIFICCGLWFFTCLIGLTIALLDAGVEMCGQEITSCFCTNLRVLSLACDDVTSIKRTTFCIAMFVLLLPLVLILFSYGVIIRVIITQTHPASRRRAYYTCATQLSVICLYFIPRIFVSVAHQVKLILNEDVNVLILCLYTFVPHMANPIIYCLRTKKIRRTLKNLIKRRILVKNARIPAVNVITNSDHL
ncbi:PREDICTED: olfactory receptor 2AP1-like [Nanorana parkeri]|uniref:olfactory receptor 2AP1-like n=1 Tax=Nanorana parkeri TaxID=125878 RepID=UPI0008543368|nr:PREDICTED: olfactory receptor 2AP1-like [Nanorana parkeri]